MFALALNCTLKRSPETSNTQALLDIVLGHLTDLGVTSRTIRPVDYDIRFGVTSDEGDGDDWPRILSLIKDADILLVATPVWLGHRASVAQMVLERLDGLYEEADEDNGQYPLYNKVAGCVVTGNEDGAHSCAETILFNLTHLGCTVPPNADSYWVGEAGPGASFIEAGGEKHEYTLKTAAWMAHNLHYFAGLLADHPIPTNLKALADSAAGAAAD